MQQDKLRDFLKFFRFHLPWFVLSAGFFAVIILTGIFFSAKVGLDQVAQVDEPAISEPAPVIDPEAYQVPESPEEPDAPEEPVAPSPSEEPESTPEPSLSPLPTPTPTPSSTPTPTEPSVIEPVERTVPSQATKYTVKPGDTLWKIAEQFYNSGYEYSLIAQENSLKDPDLILAGETLTVPALSAQPISGVTDEVTTKGSIGSGVSIDRELAGPAVSYTIVSGDCLWNIALRELGDPYRWTEIYQMNRAVLGSNPDLIYPSTVIAVPTQ